MPSETNSRIEFEKVVDSLRNDWVALRDKFPELFGDPDSTVLYGVPDSLFDALEREAPGIFADQQFEFERELARVLKRQHSIGIVAGRLVRSSLFEERAPMTVSQDDFDALGWKEFGLTCEKANQLGETIEFRTVFFHEQRVAYAGWLLTNPLFKREVADMRESEQVFLTATSVDAAAPFVEAMNSFLNRWQLSGMSSWELPEPQGPNLAGIEPSEASRRGAEMVTLQFPLTTRLPARFPVRELVSEIRNQADQPHLKEWHEILDQDSKSSPGLRRFSHLLNIQFFRNEVLPLRFGKRIAGNVAALDRAFGLYLGVGEDSVKKLRSESKRRLNIQKDGLN